nr:syntaxin-6 isoform X5 [Oryctolagus cuniculus]
MKDQMSASSVQALAERRNRQALLGDSGGQSWSSRAPDKYGRLDRELQVANSHFIEEQQAQQQLIVEQQDEQLELVSGSIGVLKSMSQRIGGELEEQAVMLDGFSHELESTQSRLDNVMKKLAKVSHMTSGRYGVYTENWHWSWTLVCGAVSQVCPSASCRPGLGLSPRCAPALPAAQCWGGLPGVPQRLLPPRAGAVSQVCPSPSCHLVLGVFQGPHAQAWY